MIAAFFRHGFAPANLLTLMVVLIVGGAVFLGLQLVRK
jgi:hypothetical protein